MAAKLSVIELVSARDAWGGIEQHVLDLVKALQERGHYVHVVARPVERFTTRYAEHCPVTTFPIKGVTDFRSIRGLAQVIREKQIDIVHTHTSRDAWIALFAVLIAGRGRIVTTRHVPFPAKKGSVHKWFYHKMAAIICVSEYVKQNFLKSKQELPADRIHVVYPGTDLKKFAGVDGSKIRKELALAQDCALIGFVGRITWEKGLDPLLEAAQLLKQAVGSRFKVLIVGGVNPNTPNYQVELQEKAVRLQIEDVICFYGFSSEVPAMLQAFDLLVLPSVTSETFGLVLCEAMECGKPVVSTNTGGQVEIVQHGQTGFLVEPNAAQEMADAMAEIIKNPTFAAQMGQNGQKRVRELFGIDRMIERLEAIFYSLL